MHPETKSTMWQYRRKKRRILGPVASGLIVGGLFFGWIVYCSIFKQASDFHDSANPISWDSRSINDEKDFVNRMSGLETKSQMSETYAMPNHMKILHGSCKYKPKTINKYQNVFLIRYI